MMVDYSFLKDEETFTKFKSILVDKLTKILQEYHEDGTLPLESNENREYIFVAEDISKDFKEDYNPQFQSDWG